MTTFQTTEPNISSYDEVLVGQDQCEDHDVKITYTLGTTGRGGK